jgi:hypothetical protein
MKRILGAVLLCLCLAQASFGAFSIASSAFLGVRPSTAFTLADDTDASGVPSGSTVWSPYMPFCTQFCLAGTSYTNSVVVPVDKTNGASVVKQLTAKRVVITWCPVSSAASHVYIFQRNGTAITMADVPFVSNSYAPYVIDFRGDIVAVAVVGPATSTAAVVVNFY